RLWLAARLPAGWCQDADHELVERAGRGDARVNGALLRASARRRGTGRRLEGRPVESPQTLPRPLLLGGIHLSGRPGATVGSFVKETRQVGVGDSRAAPATRPRRLKEPCRAKPWTQA